MTFLLVCFVDRVVYIIAQCYLYVSKPCPVVGMIEMVFLCNYTCTVLVIVQLYTYPSALHVPARHE